MRLTHAVHRHCQPGHAYEQPHYPGDLAGLSQVGHDEIGTQAYHDRPSGYAQQPSPYSHNSIIGHVS